MSRKRAAGRAAAVLTALAVFGPLSLSAARSPRFKQAIVILLDAARPDRFSCYDYGRPTTPEIDKLASCGTVFRDAYAQGTETRTSVPRILFSRYFIPEIFPNHHAIPYLSPGDLFRKADDRAVSLPRALEARGFATAAASAHEWITEGSPFAREFEVLFDLPSTVPFDPKYAAPRAEAVVDRAIEWIDKNRRRDYFLYLHIMDTHFPHYMEGDAAAFYGPGKYAGNAFSPEGTVLDPNREPTEADRKYLDALYDGGLRAADRAVGRLVSALKKWGRLDETLIIVTSDHGEFIFDRRGYAGHGGPWYEPLARIPLIVHYPPAAPRGIRENPVEAVDIAPTVLGLLKIPYPEGKSPDGRNLFGPGGEESRPVFSTGGLRFGHDKLVFAQSGAAILGRSAPDPGNIPAELYDLAADPAETRDLSRESPGLVAQLLALYREKIGPLHERHAASKTSDQPRYAFALAAPAFRRSVSAPLLADEENPGRLLRTAAPAGWLRRSAWDNSWLFAKREAEPMRISLPVPDGKYFLTADIWGAAELEIDGLIEGSRVKIRAAATDTNLRRGPSPVDIGEVEVKGEMFSAVIRPDPDQPWFALRYVGFDPIINGRRAGSVDPEREKRLRSLGYIR